MIATERGMSAPASVATAGGKYLGRLGPVLCLAPSIVADDILDADLETAAQYDIPWYKRFFSATESGLRFKIRRCMWYQTSTNDAFL